MELCFAHLQIPTRDRCLTDHRWVTACSITWLIWSHARHDYRPDHQSLRRSIVNIRAAHRDAVQLFCLLGLYNRQRSISLGKKPSACTYRPSVWIRWWFVGAIIVRTYISRCIMSQRCIIYNVLHSDPNEAESRLWYLTLQSLFDPEVFFYVLLPPIIFYAGFTLRSVSSCTPSMYVLYMWHILRAERVFWEHRRHLGLCLHWDDHLLLCRRVS